MCDLSVCGRLVLGIRPTANIESTTAFTAFSPQKIKVSSNIDDSNYAYPQQQFFIILLAIGSYTTRDIAELVANPPLKGGYRRDAANFIGLAATDSSLPPRQPYKQSEFYPRFLNEGFYAQ